MRGQGVHGAPNGALDPGTPPLPPLRRLSCRQEPRRRSPETEPISARCQTWELEARAGHLLLGETGATSRGGCGMAGAGGKRRPERPDPPRCAEARRRERREGPGAQTRGSRFRAGNPFALIGESIKMRIGNRFRRFSERREPGLGLRAGISIGSESANTMIGMLWPLRSSRPHQPGPMPGC